ncbi:MAG: hypothetical protein IJ799_01605 [Bacteroidales bacterium]|nr:hypothetical protein [Bacteroidales bacterium]
MALQLVELDEEIEYIDVDASQVPYSFDIMLVDQTYTFEIKYNEEAGFYTVDLFDADGEPLAFGEPVRYGRALFNAVENEKFPIPVIIPYCLTDEGISEVTEENFGNEVKLYLHDRRVE